MPPPMHMVTHTRLAPRRLPSISAWPVRRWPDTPYGWPIAIAPPSMQALVQTALDKGVPMILNGTPEDYGLDGLVPGVSFSTIDYQAEGEAAGTELGNCINERYDGAGQVIFAESAPGTAGKEAFETAVKDALAATAPDAEIVSTITVMLAFFATQRWLVQGLTAGAVKG